MVKHWLPDMHKGAASQDNLDFYLAKFTFWFKRRNLRSLILSIICIIRGDAPRGLNVFPIFLQSHNGGIKESVSGLIQVCRVYNT